MVRIFLQSLYPLERLFTAWMTLFIPSITPLFILERNQFKISEKWLSTTLMISLNADRIDDDAQKYP